ncbi:two-component regulator propeller domain-containing protein [Arcticibacter sp. MXS-1]|uniref:two-component regulator propeller domain-containing protein n=1 Tax=Arcticibacter sp. MXS-1 TaxID=3341726 RepID=UPI0035A8F333
MFFRFAASAETFNFKNYSVREGLANSTVYSIFQDSKGFIWFATESGVNRFDGHKFELFTMDNGLSDNEVLQISEDSKGRIWFLTLNGKLSYYYKHKFHNPANTPLLEKSISPGSYISFFEDRQHNLWFSTNQNRLLCVDRNDRPRFFRSSHYSFANCTLFQEAGQSLLAFNGSFAFRFRNNTFERFASPFYPVSSKSIQALPGKSRVIFMTSKGLAEYQNQKFGIKGLSASTKASIGPIYVDTQDRLWTGTMGQGLLLYKTLADRPELHLRGENITHILRDREGNLWVSTIGSGVYMLPYYANNALHYTVSDGLSSKAVTSIVKARNRLVLGLRSGNLDIIESGRITHELINPRNSYNPVKKLYFNAKRNSIWYASDKALIEIHPRRGNINVLDPAKVYAIKSFSFNRNRDLAVAHASGVDVISENQIGGAFLSPGRKSCFTNRSFSILYDNRGRLWFSNLQGLQYFSDGKLVELYKHIPVLRQRVTDIAELADGSVICSTYGFGVAVLKNDKLVKRITTRQGLISNICKKIVVENNKAWIITVKGISVIDFQKAHSPITQYSAENGLISDEVNDLYVQKDTAYVATNQGLSVFSPARDVSREPLPVYIRTIQFNKRRLYPEQFSSAPYDLNNLTISYTAIDFSHPSHLRYRYRLTRNAHWSETQGSSLELGSLKPGHYHLQVAARSLYTDWSKPVGLDFIIRPPYWRTWWFLLLSIAAIAAFFFLSLRHYFKSKQAEQNEKLITQTRIIALEQQALQAMMNPHFIFNVMNSIQYFINTRENALANQVLSGFARLIRKNLDICNKSYITLEEELEYLRLYLSLEKLRFGEKMDFAIETGPAVDIRETAIPSMLLQPYVENAIWHGIMPKEGNGTIKINTDKTESGIRICISDNGVGIENSRKTKNGDHVSRGMELTRQRISLLNKFKSKPITIDVAQREAGGTEVVINLPD